MDDELVSVRGKFYQKKRSLGKGGYGEVSLVESTEDQTFYALKQVHILNKDHALLIAREVQALLASVSHSNVVKLFSCCVSAPPGPPVVNFIMEYCPRGNLNQRLHKPSTREHELSWMIQLSDAISFLHAGGIVHRDLKPENVLLTSEENIKVADFGLARPYGSQNDDSTSRKRGALRRTLMHSTVGTPYYMAPEVHSGGHYTEKADVFSLGTILYAIKERRYIITASAHGKNKQRVYGAFVALHHHNVVILDYLPVGEALLRNTECRPPFKADAGFIDRRTREAICAMLKCSSQSRPDAQHIHAYLQRTRQRIQDNVTKTRSRLTLPACITRIRSVRV